MLEKCSSVGRAGGRSLGGQGGRWETKPSVEEVARVLKTETILRSPRGLEPAPCQASVVGQDKGQSLRSPGARGREARLESLNGSSTERNAAWKSEPLVRSWVGSEPHKP